MTDTQQQAVAQMTDDEIAHFFKTLYGPQGFPITVYGARELVHALFNVFNDRLAAQRPDPTEWDKAQGYVATTDWSTPAQADSAPMAPIGCKLMPIEPTPEMIDAYLKTQGDSAKSTDKAWGISDPRENFKAGYNAMLEAAPTPIAPTADAVASSLKRIAHELRTYNPAADEYKGEHIHKVWAREIDSVLTSALTNHERIELYELREALERASAAPVQSGEPVAWFRKTDITELTDSEPETNGWTPLFAAPAEKVTADAVAQVPEGCTPADAQMLRKANHALAAENDQLRRALGPFARLVSTDRLSWAMVEYCVEGDPEKQTFQRPQMQRAFNRAAEVYAPAALANSTVEQTASDTVDVRASVLEEAAQALDASAKERFETWAPGQWGHRAFHEAAGMVRALKDKS